MAPVYEYVHYPRSSPRMQLLRLSAAREKDRLGRNCNAIKRQSSTTSGSR